MAAGADIILRALVFLIVVLVVVVEIELVRYSQIVSYVQVGREVPQFPTLWAFPEIPYAELALGKVFAAPTGTFRFWAPGGEPVPWILCGTPVHYVSQVCTDVCATVNLTCFRFDLQLSDNIFPEGSNCTGPGVVTPHSIFDNASLKYFWKGSKLTAITWFADNTTTRWLATCR